MKKIFLLMTVVLPFVFISCGDDEDEPKNSKKHEYVDLGLPSGALWATCNIGANTPEEYGDYFAWGETAPKEVYDWSTYKWCNGSDKTLTKYCTDSSIGTVDNKTILDPEDDAARINWGSKWRMPTKEEQEDLIKYCTWQWTQRNGVNGYWVTGPNGNSIFLPAAGYRWGNSLEMVGTFGHDWSSTPIYNRAYSLFFSSGGVYYEQMELSDIRAYGCTIRAVRVWQD